MNHQGKGRINIGQRVVSLQHRVAGVFNGLTTKGRAKIKTQTGYVYPLPAMMTRENTLAGARIAAGKLTN